MNVKPKKNYKLYFLLSFFFILNLIFTLSCLILRVAADLSNTQFKTA